MTSIVVVAPRICGSLSAISSVIILCKILSSYHKLSTIYHRIMFGMSLSNMIGSLAICLTSLPMPSEAPYGVVYEFDDAKRMGNQLSCEIQGFATMLGLVTSFAYNGTLSLYYAFAIGLKWKDGTIQKRHEVWLFHLVPIVLGLVMAVVPWIFGIYNPSELGVSCVLAAVRCDSNQEGEKELSKSTICHGQNEHMFHIIMTMLIALVGILFVCLFVCFSHIMGGALGWWPNNYFDDASSHDAQDGAVSLRNKRKLQSQQVSRKLGPSRNVDFRQAVEQRKYACSLGVQITAYIIPLIMSFLFQGLIILHHGYDGQQSFHGAVTSLSLIFSSLQGFFNMVDFIGHKVYNYRRVYRHVSILESIFIVIKSSEPDPILITGLSIVEISERLVHIDAALHTRNIERGRCKSDPLGDDFNNDIESDAKQSVGNHVFAFGESQPSLGGFSSVYDAQWDTSEQ